MRIPRIKFHDGLIWKADLLESIDALRTEGRLNEEAFARFLKRKKDTNLGLYLVLALCVFIFLAKPLSGMVPVLGALLILYLTNIRVMDGKALLHIRGVRTEGEIVKVKLSHYRGKYWEIKCKYSDVDGHEHNIEPAPSQLYLKALPNWTPYKGEKVQIVYEGNKPKRADLILPAEYNIYDLIK